MPTSIYFVDHFEGVCNNGEHSVPHYIQVTYPTLRKCCEASFAREKCFTRAGLKDAGEEASSYDWDTWSPTSMPTIIYWRVDDDTGTCVDGPSDPAPGRLLADDARDDFDSYLDYRQCCAASREREKCLEDAPPGALGPTAAPTQGSSEGPSVVPSSLPSGSPLLPTARPTGGDCSDARWHYGADYSGGCTNAEVPDGAVPMLLYPSWQECCQVFFLKGQDCRVDDRCRSAAEVVAFADRPRIEFSCDSSHREYHPDADRRDGCTNSRDVRESWQGLGLLFGTALECCQEVYFDRGHHCSMYNVCASPAGQSASPTESGILAPTTIPADKVHCGARPWHPDPDLDEDGCSNSVGDYPDNWDEQGSGMMFDSAQRCCEAHYTRYGLGCGVRDTCAAASSCASAKWHPTWDYSKCTNDAASEVASDLTFDDARMCCINVFNFPDCPTADVCESAIITGSPSAKPTPLPTPQPTPLPTPLPTRISQVVDGNDTADDRCSPRSTFAECKVQMCAWDFSTNSCTGPGARRPPTPSGPSGAEGRCRGKTRRQCAKDDKCGWDSSKLSCARSPQSTSKPLPPPTSRPSPPPTSEPSRGGRCAGKTKRQCRDDAGCGWNESERSCADSNLPVDVGGGGDNGRNDCEGRPYHPRTAVDPTCTDDNDYPSLWDEPGERAKYMHATAAHCCAAHYADARSCRIVESCCSRRRWHPTGAAPRTCTNSGEYLSTWNLLPYRERYLHGTAEECCREFFGDGECHRVDVCQGQ